MSRQLDFSRLYLLLEAFDLLGQHLYGSEWAGTEPWARPSPLEEVRRQKERLRDQLRTLRTEVAALEEDSRDAIDRAEAERISEALDAKRKAQERAEEERRSLPDLTGAYAADQAAYERRQKTEESLLAALREGAIQLRFGTDQVVHWPSWREHPDFSISFELSLARAPRALSSRRRAPLFVERQQFTDWLQDLLPLTAPAYSTVTPEQRCVAFLKEEIARGRTMTKPRYRATAMQKIPGLSERAFNRVWANTVPRTWSRSGRRKAPS